MGNAASAPVINDVSTDLSDPPQFPESKHHTSLPDGFKSACQKHYSHLQAVRVPGGDAAAVFAAAKRAGGWQWAVWVCGSGRQSQAYHMQCHGYLHVPGLSWRAAHLCPPGLRLPAAAALPNTCVVRADAAAGALELLAVTPLMRFKDDVAVRVRTLPATAAAAAADGQAAAAGEQMVVVVDVRSASRMGKGDLGANAARIGKYLEALRAELGLGQKNGSS